MYSITCTSSGITELSFHLTDEMKKDPTCRICLDDYESSLDALRTMDKLAKLRVVKLGCLHHFHETCMKNYLMEQGSSQSLTSRTISVPCPLCRKKSALSPSSSERLRCFVNWIKKADMFEV